MAISNGWRFSGNLRDYVGLRNHAAPIGGAPQYAPGRHGTALVCEDGRGAVAAIPAWRYYYDVSPGRLAVECWVTSTSSAHTVRTAVSKGEAWSLDLCDEDGHVRFVHGSYVVTTTTDVLDGDPHHILVTYDYIDEDPYVYEYRIYVDGVLVETDSGSATVWIDGESELVYFGCHGEGVQGAEALIEDVRIWSDPIHDDEVASVNMATPVADFELGAWKFGGTGSTVIDLGSLGNNLTITANGARAAGTAGGDALIPVDPAAGWTATGSLTVEKGIDRFSISGWFRMARSGVNQRVLEITRSSGDPILAFDINSENRAGVYAWNDDGDALTAFQSAAMGTTTWYKIFISVYPGSIRWKFGSRETWGSVPPGFYPLNAPAFTDQDEIRLDGRWQDVRLIETYVPPDEWAQWDAIPFAQPTGIRRGDGKPMRMYVKRDGELVEIKLGRLPGAPEPDTAPPSVPTGLSASGITQTGCTISWAESVDAGEEPDVTPPTVPAGLVATTVTQSGFTVNWSESYDG
jgi:hypothetical protein